MFDCVYKKSYKVRSRELVHSDGFGCVCLLKHDFNLVVPRAYLWKKTINAFFFDCDNNTYIHIVLIKELFMLNDNETAPHQWFFFFFNQVWFDVDSVDNIISFSFLICLCVRLFFLWSYSIYVSIYITYWKTHTVQPFFFYCVVSKKKVIFYFGIFIFKKNSWELR